MSNTFDDPYYKAPPEKPIPQPQTNYPVPATTDQYYGGPSGYAPQGQYDPYGNPYASPQPYGTFPQPFYGKPHRGETVMILGVIGLVLFFVLSGACAFLVPFCLALSIPAWVMGQKDLKEIAAGERDPRGKGTTTAGMIMGIVTTVLSILGTIAMIAVVAIYVIFFGFIAIGAAAGS